ncbi:PAS domain S-box protein [bacterium]|nr:PAS domain S-box protein [bacterium]
MTLFQKTSIRSTIILIVFMTTAVLLLIGFTAVFVENVLHTRRNLVDQNRLQALLMAEYLVSPVLFEDAEAAIEILEKASVIPGFQSAHIHDSEGRVFAAYGDTSLYQCREHMERQHRFEGGTLHTKVTIAYHGKQYGNLYLQSSTIELQQRILFLGGLLFGLLVLLSIIGILVADKWQRVITSPIGNLVESMGDVSASKNYATQVTVHADNEIGTLYTEFNQLLRTIHEHQSSLLQTRKIIQDQHDQFLAVLNAFPENLYVADLETHTILFANESMHEQFGRDLIGQTCFEVLHGLSNECPFCTSRDLRVGADAVQWEQYNRNLDRYYSITDKIIQWPDSRSVRFEVAVDITELKRTEQVLRSSEARWRSYVENAPYGIFIADSEGCFVDVNPAATAITGFTRDELRERSIPDLLDPESLQKGLQHFEDLEVHNRANTEVRFRKKDGSIGEWSVSAVRLREDRYLGYVEDITDRKLAEEEQRRLEEQLIQSQKMESIGRLAGGVAHDYNNMLSVIIGYTDLIVEELVPETAMYEDMQEILTAALRSRDITRQLLAFARKQAISPKVLDLNETIAGMLKMLKRLIGEDIELKLQPKPDLWPVEMDPSQIDQILANLCVNARDAIDGVGHISIETNNVVFDKPYCTDHAECSPGEYVMVAVSDDGSGMDRETLNNIFEPFFTTKGVDEGTGLGLATVYGIIRQNDGFINTYSEPGKGTTFRFYIPACLQTMDESTTGESDPSLMGAGETVLVVEDEEQIMKLACKMLEGLRYQVLAADEPKEALRISREHEGDIQLLLTDVVMPHMNGRELAEAMSQHHPELKVLYMSGYTANVIATRGIIEEGVHYIQKPFSRVELGAKIKRII